MAIKVEEHPEYTQLQAYNLADTIELIQMCNHPEWMKKILIECLEQLPEQHQENVYAHAGQYTAEQVAAKVKPTHEPDVIYLTFVGIDGVNRPAVPELEQHFKKWDFEIQWSFSYGYVKITNLHPKLYVQNKNQEFNQMGFFEHKILKFKDFLEKTEKK